MVVHIEGGQWALENLSLEEPHSSSSSSCDNRNTASLEQIIVRTAIVSASEYS